MQKKIEKLCISLGLIFILLALVSHSSIKQMDIVPQSAKDVNPPILDSIYFQPTTIYAGESFEIYAQAHDNNSGDLGVSHIDVTFMRTEGGPFFGTLLWNESLSCFAVILTTALGTPPGQYQLYEVVVEDLAGNSRLYYYWDPILNGQYLTILQSTDDSTAPYLNSIWFSDTTINVDEIFRIYALASDDISGVHYIEAILNCPDNSYGFSINMTWNEPLDCYYGEETISQGVMNGTWYLYEVDLYDYVGNSRFLYSPTDFERLYLNINSPNEDLSPPILDALWFTPTHINAGEILFIYAQAHDDISGVSYLTVYFMCPDGSEGIYVNLYWNNSLSCFYNERTILPSAMSGAWYLSEVDLYDLAGNYRILFTPTDLSREYFYVADLSPPDLYTPLVWQNGSVTISWSSIYNTDYYNLYRSDSFIDSIDGLDFNSIYGTSYTDYPILSGTYYYVVVAVNEYGQSDPSECMSVEFSEGIPKAPTFNSPILSSDGGVDLSWSVELSADYYYVYRSTSYINMIIGLSPQYRSFNSYRDYPPGPGEYYYVVVAINERGSSSISNCVSVIIPPTSSPPTDTNPFGSISIDGFPILMILGILGLTVMFLYNRKLHRI